MGQSLTLASGSSCGSADDGRGFDPATVSPDHLGLGIIRERAEAIGVELHVGSETGKGTEVEVVWE